MEKFNLERFEDENSPERALWRKWKEAIAPRLHDATLNRQRSYRIRDVQAVEEQLFDHFDGDSTKVTDQDISKAFDEFDNP